MKAWVGEARPDEAPCWESSFSKLDGTVGHSVGQAFIMTGPESRR
jgi:hypothetical protein